jgi:formiminotetrahydrofolate cyclodeaminase
VEDANTTSLSDLPLRALVERLASHDPVPGGGSAAAIAGAMGAALIGMVVELTVGRPAAEGHEAQLADLGAAATQRHAALLALAQRDADAYQAVVLARRLPRDSEPERQARREALGHAMRAAAAVPLATAREALAVLQDAAVVAPIGNVNAVSDAGVAALLGWAALHGAILNVRINLPYLREGDPLRESAPAELAELAGEGERLRRSAETAVDERMGGGGQ